MWIAKSEIRKMPHALEVRDSHTSAGGHNLHFQFRRRIEPSELKEVARKLGLKAATKEQTGGGIVTTLIERRRRKPPLKIVVEHYGGASYVSVERRSPDLTGVQRGNLLAMLRHFSAKR